MLCSPRWRALTSCPTYATFMDDPLLVKCYYFERPRRQSMHGLRARTQTVTYIRYSCTRILLQRLHVQPRIEDSCGAPVGSCGRRTPVK